MAILATSGKRKMNNKLPTSRNGNVVVQSSAVAVNTDKNPKKFVKTIKAQ